MKIKRIVSAVFVALLISLGLFFAFSEETGVKTVEEAEKYLLSEVLDGKTEIRMKADAALVELLSDTQNLYDLFSHAKIATASWTFDESELYLREIIAYPESVYCESMADAVKAFERCYPKVILHLSKAFYDEFTGNDFEKFFLLDKEAMIESKDCVYYGDTRFFIYDNIRYTGNIVYIDSVETLRNHVRECAQNMEPSISYTLSDDMYDMIMFNQSIENEIYAACGIYSYDWYIWGEYKQRDAKNIVYYPGAKVLWALENNALDMLTEEETKLYELAIEISEKAVKETAGKPNMEIRLEEALVRGIAKRCTYQTGEDVYNTAIGALVYGTADCDGYSDAMYLLGNLAGLKVYHQQGYMNEGGCHMWNLVFAGGSWHFTDATGCDLNWDSYADAIRLEWLGMGMETALTHYIWQPVSQYALVEPDDKNMIKMVFDGHIFDSIQQARAFLETVTEKRVNFVINGIGKDEASKAAEDAIYGYGGPHTSEWENGRLCVQLHSTWFDRENFYDCYTQEDVIHALSSEHAEIILRLNGEVFGTYLSDGGSKLSQMEKAAGIQSSQRSLYDSTRVFLYNDIVRK